MIKTPDVSADYYPTHVGIILQSWCPICGQMIPLVEERNIDYISNNRKKRIAHRCAIAYNRGCKDFRNIVNSKLRDVNDIQIFIDHFARETGLSSEEVFKCCS